jgi:predicted hotdog family 3-hydroxylacyl-ACP dehydratase
VSSPLLDSAGIAARIPHAGTMCLLDHLVAWDAQRLHGRAISHRAANNPLRSASGLLATAAIEYAAQAAALHGALLADQAGQVIAPGYLASARAVRFHGLRLDTLDGPLDVHAERQAGDARQLLYGFLIEHAGQAVADGRLAVVLNTPLGLSP